MGASAASSGFAASCRDTYRWSSLSSTGGVADVEISYPSSVDTEANSTAPWSAAVNGASALITGVSAIDATTLAVTLDAPPSAGATVELTYQPPPHDVRRASDGAAAAPQSGSTTAT